MLIINYKSLEQNNSINNNKFLEEEDEDEESFFRKTFKYVDYFENLMEVINPREILINAGIENGSKYFIGENNREFINQWDDYLQKYCEDIIKSKKYRFDIQSSREIYKYIIKSIKEDISTTLNEEIKNSKYIDIFNFTLENMAKEKDNKINKFNILVLGESQIGKTTLIVNLLKLKDMNFNTISDNGASTTKDDIIYSSSETLKHI